MIMNDLIIVEDVYLKKKICIQKELVGISKPDLLVLYLFYIHICLKIQSHQRASKQKHE